MRYNNILEAIGHTPLVKLNRIVRGSKAEVYAKCDYLNPGGSVKDRIAVTMIEEAESKGWLRPGGISSCHDAAVTRSATTPSSISTPTTC